MSERKVLNKYFPPDFDPSKIPRLRLGKSRQIKVRLTAPFSMRCETCGQWIGKGTKFNARKESVEGEKFHSIQIYRFYIRCQRCAAEITFKTDPENLNYEVEKGAQRNFEPWREEKELNEELEKEKEEAEEDPLKALENRTEESRREMEIMDALDQVRLLNAKGEKAAKNILEVVRDSNKEELDTKKEEEEEDKRLAKLAFAESSLTVNDGRRIKRAREEDQVAREQAIKKMATSSDTFNNGLAQKPLGLSKALSGIKQAVRIKNTSSAVAVVESKDDNETNDNVSLTGMLGAYGGDSDSSESE